MDGDRFDALTRALAGRPNRRQTLKAMAAGLLGGAFGARTVLPADAQNGQVDVCYQTGNPRRPFHFLRLDPRGAERLKDRRGFVVCEDDEVLDRETCSCSAGGTEPEPEPDPEPQEPPCVAVGEECRRNGDCCSHWCSQGVCACTGSGANCAGGQGGEVEVCYQTGNRFRPSVTFNVSQAAASRLKGRRGYVVCDAGERLDAANCTCHPELGEEEPGPSCQAVGAACQSGDQCCSHQCPNGFCHCGGRGGTCSTNGDCCSNSCANGTCGCLNGGASCQEDAACCSNECIGGVCLCAGTGVSCQADAECCSNVCVNGACACAAGGAVCTSDANCCPGFFCGDGQCECTEGSCPAGQVCHEGTCCSPQCPEEGECGSDGCGGDCGVCGAGQVCQNDLRVCAVETCPTDMSPWCHDGECCTGLVCNPTATGEGTYQCALTTENTVVCAFGNGPLIACTTSESCPTGQQCIWTCGLGNSCAAVA